MSRLGSLLVGVPWTSGLSKVCRRCLHRLVHHSQQLGRERFQVDLIPRRALNASTKSQYSAQGLCEGLRVTATLCPCLDRSRRLWFFGVASVFARRTGGAHRSELGGWSWRWQRRPPPQPDRGRGGAIPSVGLLWISPAKLEAQHDPHSGLRHCCEESGAMKRLAIALALTLPMLVAAAPNAECQIVSGGDCLDW
jgi:hypothetical protein